MKTHTTPRGRKTAASRTASTAAAGQSKTRRVRSAGSAWIPGVTLAALLLTVLAGVQLVLQRVPFGPEGNPSDLRVAVVHCLLLGYLPSSILYLQARTRQTLLALKPALDLPEPQTMRIRDDVGVYPLLHLIAAAVVGLIVAWFGPFLSGPGSANPWSPATWSPEVVWHRLLGPVVGVGIAWFAYAIVRESARLSLVARHLAPLDLLDLRPVAPFTNQALTHALVTVGMLAVFGLFAVDQGISSIVVIMSILTLGLAVASLLLPLRGVHDRIATAKSNELDWIDQRIRDHRADLQSGPHDRDGRLADLVAYRTLITEVREWPFSQSTLMRVVLYLLIPLVSWLVSGLAGALIERSVFGS